MTPYSPGDKVRYMGREYVVEKCYAAEGGGYDLRISDTATTVWTSADKVEPVVEPVVDTGQGELF